MRNFSKTKLTDKLINLTKHTVRMYDEFTGDIMSFHASNQRLPKKPKCDTVMYILDSEGFREIAKTGRRLDDIAVITSSSLGRNGKSISHLVWGGDLSYYVLYREDPYITYQRKIAKLTSTLAPNQ